MRTLIGLVLAAALVWSGYWVVGSRAARAGIEGWFDARRAEGWTAGYDGLALRGFPNRFDATLDEVVLADPASGWGWRAPFFQLFALSYRPHHLIAVWPDTQGVTTPAGDIAVASGRMRASAVFRPGDGFALDRGNLVADALSLDGGAWGAEVRRMLLAARRTGTGAARYRIGFEADDIAADAGLRALLDPDGALPATVERVHLDATLAFADPDRAGPAAAGPERPTLEDIRLTSARIVWGAVELGASGALAVGRDGLPEGRIDLQAQNWRVLLALLVAAGLVQRAFAPAVENALGAIAGTGDASGGGTLDLPLIFADGRISLGPIPLGRAPRLTRE